MVLPVLFWEKIFIANMQADNSLSHEDKVKMFGVDFFNLGHYSNWEQREHYVKVAHTVLARIAEELPGLPEEALLLVRHREDSVARDLPSAPASAAGSGLTASWSWWWRGNRPGSG